MSINTTNTANNLNIQLPTNYQDHDVIFKMNTKKENKKIESFRSFAILVFTNCIIINNKRITINNFYTCLKKYNLSDSIPAHIKLSSHRSENTQIDIENFDWSPHCYGGPTVWPFYFPLSGKNIHCSLTGHGGYIYIRVHDLTPGVAETILTSLTDELLSYWVDPVPQKTVSIFTPARTIQGYQWSPSTMRPHRDMDTIYIHKELKEKMIQQLSKFYASSAMYDRYGVTWKRVHLFHSLPGCGKTSTIFALASYFNKNICKFTLTPNLNSQDIEKLFQTCKDDAFVLLEDVDALFTERSTNNGVDFSTLLNCMDGVGTKRGLVLFMTTNHVHKLDEALIRPGRVDMCVEFKLPGREELRQALKILGSQWEHQHEEYLDKFAENKSIAALQAHLFECVMDEKETILF